MSSSLYRYDCENFSFKDIVKFVEFQGYEVSPYDNRYNGGCSGFEINDLFISIRLPNPDDLKDIRIWRSSGPPEIFWQTMNKFYRDRSSARESGDKEKIKKAEKEYEEYHKKAKKLYNQLKRRFAIKKGEFPKSIKDLNDIKKILGQSNKKSWWPFCKK